MPPYCGVPRLSHQLPVAVLVVAVVMGDVVVIVTVEDVVILVVDVVVIVFVIDDVVVDVVDALQDVRSIATISKKLKPNQINLFFNLYLRQLLISIL